jgi:methylated-DNA-protein-cysteine methyltransferase-like protein
MKDEEIREIVYEYVKDIPKGYVSTYGNVAKKVGASSPRQIGRILHQNPDGDETPCHRVVFSDGSLASGYVFGGPDAQKKKLEEEGVDFLGDKVDLALLL